MRHSSEPICFTRPVAWPATRRSRRPPCSCSRNRSRSTTRRGTRTPLPASCIALARIEGYTGRSRRVRWRAGSAPSPFCPPANPARSSPCLRPAWQSATGSRANSSGRRRARRAGARPRRGAGLPGAARGRLRAKSASGREPRSYEEADALIKHALDDLTGARPQPGGNRLATSSSPTGASGGTVTPTLLATSTSRSPSPGRWAAGHTSGGSWPSGRIRSSCSAAGTRWSRQGRSSPRSGSSSGGLLVEPAAVGRRGPSPAWRPRRCESVFGMFSRLEESTDIQELSVLLRLHARRCDAPRESCARRLPTPTRRSRPAATLGVAQQAVKQAIVEGSRGRARAGRPGEGRAAARARRERAAGLTAAVSRCAGEALSSTPGQ